MVPPPSDAHAYCRAVEAYLCQKNDGHLIRIVGPSFEQVVSWAEQGIPLRVAQTGIDRYFARYYRKGPRRRPVRIEFCEADVLDAFDEWRRAVGVSVQTVDAEGGTPVEEPVPAPGRARRSLRSHVESLLARLTVLRGSDRLGPVADAAIDEAIRALDALPRRADQARGDDRQAVVDAVIEAGRRLHAALATTLPPEVRARLEAEAAVELEPFSARMAPEAYRAAVAAAFNRHVREHFGLPDFSW